MFQMYPKATRVVMIALMREPGGPRCPITSLWILQSSARAFPRVRRQMYSDMPSRAHPGGQKRRRSSTSSRSVSRGRTLKRRRQMSSNSSSSSPAAARSPSPRAKRFRYGAQSRYAVVENLGMGNITSTPLAANFETIPEDIPWDLRTRFQRRNIIGARHVEFAHDQKWEFGDKFTFSSEGPVSTKAFRPYIIWEVEPDYLVCWIYRTNSRRGLNVPHIRTGDRYKYLGLSNVGDEIGNHTRFRPLGSRLAPELVKLKLIYGYCMYGDLEPESGLGLNLAALRQAQAQLPPVRPGYERPSRAAVTRNARQSSSTNWFSGNDSPDEQEDTAMQDDGERDSGLDQRVHGLRFDTAGGAVRFTYNAASSQDEDVAKRTGMFCFETRGGDVYFTYNAAPRAEEGEET
ncbi:hypothetical protein FB567DRAFT_583755 [Paraphoma chrysanthemicola]|uniref:Uncharacterized protein n=1 Tax=Paraphoma chrysanthemicola TaxID=798071 RepID=A0A8K0QVU7_9PLEO|nr:hypothetical protein FB567DRAFT_583755 [Paraphoma chrysanthemicola]